MYLFVQYVDAIKDLLGLFWSRKMKLQRGLLNKGILEVVTRKLPPNKDFPRLGHFVACSGAFLQNIVSIFINSRCPVLLSRRVYRMLRRVYRMLWKSLCVTRRVTLKAFSPCLTTFPKYRLFIWDECDHILFPKAFPKASSVSKFLAVISVIVAFVTSPPTWKRFFVVARVSVVFAPTASLWERFFIAISVHRLYPHLILCRRFLVEMNVILALAPANGGEILIVHSKTFL